MLKARAGVDTIGDAEVLTVAQQAGVDLSPIAPVLFYAAAALTALGAWAIVLSRQIVRMAVYLLVTLVGVAGLYFMMEAELLAAVQLIVYAGGTLILIVFGVMLTSRSPFAKLEVEGWELGVACLIGAVIASLMVFAFIRTPLPEARAPAGAGYADVAAVGRGLLSHYLVPFEVAAVLLLVVMVGAAYIARRREA
jgi:NADH-quinone oxidoreductase subunit J